ncbi:hypothetical protein [Oleiharenicola sp. Vm1]|jgi:hypothetical protein|uniref:hypothetical protein n=1 Tax=Oleiharenicola sp. Vm1 TaxID=3398393 RepID=UPI0039F4A04C
MDAPDLHSRLMDDARRYDPAAHTRGLLGPFRDVILLQRAKFMSYEQISATFARHGLKVSPAAVGVFCRRHYTKAEIERARQGQASRPAPGRPPGAPAKVAPALGASAPGPAATGNGKRGPKIARDNY